MYKDECVQLHLVNAVYTNETDILDFVPFSFHLKIVIKPVCRRSNHLTDHNLRDYINIFLTQNIVTATF